MIERKIDHTCLKAFATKDDINKLCNEAIKYNFYSVCVNPCFVSLAKNILVNSNVRVATVVGFPLGANTSETKEFETIDAIKNGADEIDMVINIGALKNKDYNYLLNDIEVVVRAAKGKLVKIIIETCYLTNEEIEEICHISEKAGAQYVKTSTGFGTGGAKVEDIVLIKKNISSNIGIKASGGIKTKEDASNMLNAGATRLGTSSSIDII